ncbi:hypothetical protein [Marinomonas foliarum]|uniref:SMODS and SLOG-associating 2TM effector domain-containing protein n=1 Tax=Marinomonas foliarum TaxID=491950 RepID=A0ABX7ILY7_9GAMM|nr:hypothetical protein [Marinomonas foliarum]QRV23347.1 hypothetical protein JSY38_14995 [Marinomonas foliarum]
MNKQKRLEEFHKAIDEDKGFKTQRNLITYISFVILAVNFSGAIIKEANTFLFKIDFSNPKGIILLLSITLAFCIIRYLNYAQKYLKSLSQFWKERFLDDYRIKYYDHESGEVGGLFGSIISTSRDHHLQDEERQGKTTEASSNYITHINPLNRVYAETWAVVQNQKESGTYFPLLSHLGKRKFLKVLNIEFSYRFSAYIYHRENLDILAPILLATCAYLSIVFHEILSNLFL